MASKQTQRKRELELHRAIGRGDVGEATRLLSDGVDPNCIGESSHNYKYAFPALCTAIQAAHRAITQAKEIAILKEACPGERFVETDFATFRTDCIEIIRRLIAAGADPNRGSITRTPLSVAAGHCGDVELTRLLLDAGANPASKSWSPFSNLPRPKGGLAYYGDAIHEATEKGFTEVVQLLCSRGADPLARNHDGRTARQIAVERGHADIVHFLEQYERSNVAG